MYTSRFHFYNTKTIKVNIRSAPFRKKGVEINTENTFLGDHWVNIYLAALLSYGQDDFTTRCLFLCSF